MKKLTTSPTFRFLLGTLVIIVPGSLILVIAAALFTRTTYGRAFAARFTQTTEAA